MSSNNINEVYYIALAGLLHDIGKFAERAKEYKENIKGFHKDAIEQTINELRELCQPSYGSGRDKKYTHEHAVITGAIIKILSECKVFPDNLSELTVNLNGVNQDFIRLSASHHKPETLYEKIISIADRLASGFERTSYDDYNKEINVKDYKKTRLNSIFENIGKNENNTYDYKYINLTFDENCIFPKKPTSEISEDEYKKHFANFINDAQQIYHKDNIRLWLEHFNGLYMIYTSQIPSFTVGYNPPFISLYDHSRTTAAIACAIYNYLKNSNGSDSSELLNDNYEDKKIFTFIQGNFYGIQDFIFSKGGQTTKNSAKILRGRSFYVSLLSELTANMICDELNLTPLSIIINAAGKFLIIADNSEFTKRKLKEIQEYIDNWLYNNFFMEVSLGIVSIDTSPKDLQIGNLASVFKNLAEKTEEQKYHKFDPFKLCGPVNNYPTSFSELCSYCGKRKREKTEKDICNICQSHMLIGEKLIKTNKIAVALKGSGLYGEKIDILDRYEVYFDVDGKLSNFSNKLVEYWDISIDTISKTITPKFINNYAAKSNEHILTFDEIAEKALKNENDSKKGIKAIASLKADIDNLGTIFRNIKNINLSLYADISRRLNLFFAFYLPRYLKSKNSNIYTIFAGGDDLFLIGPWNEIIDTSKEIRKSFKEYVCNNPKISISAGITIHKTKEPIDHIRIFAEESLEKSKSIEGKDALTVFGYSVKWNDFVEELYPFIEKLRELENNFSRVYFYKINEIIDMAEKEKNIYENFKIENLSSLKWRALLNYYTVRNIQNEKCRSDVDNIIKDLCEKIEKHRANLKIPLWYYLYESRKIKT